jgi:hypothetical protein
VREAVRYADAQIVEEWKWMGSPVWSCDGVIAVENAHKDKVKPTFFHGASVADPDGLFNAGLNGRAWRAIDAHTSRRSVRQGFVVSMGGLGARSMHRLCSGSFDQSSNSIPPARARSRENTRQGRR